MAESAWSTVASFFANTANDAPTVPLPANPSDGAGVNVFTPTLSVRNSTDLDGDVLTYEFEVYSDAGLTNLLTSVTALAEGTGITSWTVPVSLTENVTYYWHSRAYDGTANSGWMTTASFVVNTANDSPAAPGLSAPAEGSSLSTITPTFSIVNAVDPDSDNISYDFEVYTGTIIQSVTGGLRTIRE